MRIIKEGVIPKPAPPPWPIDTDLECWHCSAIFQIDEFDVERGLAYCVTERRPGGDSVLTVSCPFCKVEQIFSRTEYKLGQIGGRNNHANY